MRRVLIGLAVLVLLAVPSALLLLLDRGPGDAAKAPPPSVPPPTLVDPLDAPWKVGEAVEALSALGWQPAVIDELGPDAAAIHYTLDGLAPERLDLRLLRRPEPAIAGTGASDAPTESPGRGKGSRLPPAGGGGA